MRRALGLGLLLGFALVALAADLIAAELPLYLVVDGERYVLPCLTAPARLLGEDQQSLAARATSMLGTPIPYGPLAQRPGGRLEVLAPPSRAHLLGTDDRGRDVAARLVHGARVACLIGPLAVLVYVFIGTFVGAWCAASRLADTVLGRVIEASLCVPPLVLLLAVQGLSGRSTIAHVAFVIALAEWPHAARLVRAEALRVAALPHVVAARSIGASSPRVALLHVLPMALGPVVVLASFGLGQAVLYESALGLLGFGVQAPTASFGELLAQGLAHPRAWLIAPPSLAIAGIVLGARLSLGAGGDGLDPSERIG